MGVGIAGVVIGYISDKFGPYKTTYVIGLIDCLLLLLFALLGIKSFMAYAVLCILQGNTYGGMTTLNPIMITDSFDSKGLGVMLAITGLAFGVVGLLGA